MCYGQAFWILVLSNHFIKGRDSLPFVFLLPGPCTYCVLSIRYADVAPPRFYPFLLLLALFINAFFCCPPVSCTQAISILQAALHFPLPSISVSQCLVNHFCSCPMSPSSLLIPMNLPWFSPDLKPPFDKLPNLSHQANLCYICTFITHMIISGCTLLLSTCFY